MQTFKGELEALLNKYSMESGSDTPDFVLAKFLCGALRAFDEATLERTEWMNDDGERVTLKP